MGIDKIKHERKKFPPCACKIPTVGGTICLESSAESREYMLTYFWGMETYFYWGNGSIIYLLGDGSNFEIFGGWIPHPPWICSFSFNHDICLHIHSAECTVSVRLLNQAGRNNYPYNPKILWETPGIEK